jgi:hypothetical protein
MKKIFLAILVVLFTMLAVIPFLRSRSENRAKVRNESGQLLQSLSITIGGETTRIEDVKTGESRSFPFHIHSDDHFEVEGQLVDGTPLRDSFGYVTNGMHGEHAEFIIQPKGDIDFNQGQYSAK